MQKSTHKWTCSLMESEMAVIRTCITFLREAYAKFTSAVTLRMLREGNY